MTYVFQVPQSAVSNVLREQIRSPSNHLFNVLLCPSDSDEGLPFFLQVQDGLQGGRAQALPQHQEEVRTAPCLTNPSMRHPRPDLYNQTNLFSLSFLFSLFSSLFSLLSFLFSLSLSSLFSLFSSLSLSLSQGGCGDLLEYYSEKRHAAGCEGAACVCEVPQTAQSGGAGDGESLSRRLHSVNNGFHLLLKGITV